MTISTQGEDLVLALIEYASDVRWEELANGAGFTLVDRHMLRELHTRARVARAAMISAVPSIEGGEGDSGPSQTSPSSEVFAPLPCRPEGPSPLADEVAWLIEETWSGFVHYVHRDCEPVRVGLESTKPAYISRNLPFLTKDVAEAMRFTTREEADAWRKRQPHWFNRGDQFQVRGHMWPAPSTEAQPLRAVERERDEALTNGHDRIAELHEELDASEAARLKAEDLNRKLVEGLRRGTELLESYGDPGDDLEFIEVRDANRSLLSSISGGEAAGEDGP